MDRGKYLVIEGNDGTGKSTQVQLLAEYLEKQGITTYVPQEPGGTPISDALRAIIKDGSLARSPETNVLLFTAARSEIWREANQHLQNGNWVISSRNYVSTLAYQSKGEGVNEALILETTRNFTDEHYMQPDYTFILTLDDTNRKKRLAGRDDSSSKDTFESRNDDFQDKVNHGYLDIAKERGYITIDASRSIEEIFEDIVAHIQELS